jgi:hypothetical protein
MANGFDQYLANHITASGAFQVVVDPKKADAIFTDRLGEAFEERLRQILPAPAEEKKDKDKDGEKASKQQETTRLTGSTFGRGKGTLFLVETATQSVLWSVYEPPRNATAKELDRTAQRVVDRLKKPSKSN